MNPELIRMTLMFLQRVDIKGGEALAMVQVCQALQAMAQPDLPPQPHRANGAMQFMPANGETEA